MFLLGWLVDIILTTIITLVLALLFGNSPITFLTMIFFPFIFIILWQTLTKKIGGK